MRTPHGEPQESSRNIIGDKDPGRYVPIILLLYSCSSQLRVPSEPFILSLLYSYYIFLEFSAKSLYTKSSEGNPINPRP